jgi:putative hemolysin
MTNAATPPDSSGSTDAISPNAVSPNAISPAAARASRSGHASLPLGTGFGELRAGNLGVRVATNQAEIEASMRLRYQVFYEEMGARPSAEAARSRSDTDAFDEVADHLVVVDHEIGEGADAVVGTYRLIREEAAEKLGHFYSSDEYDISKILAYPGRKLELGRSCVGREHRGRAAMQLLWRGIAAYVDLHRIELMFGCASLPGTDPEAIAAELSYLYANHLAPAEICPRALAARYVDMQRRDMATLDARRVLASLPPLMKGYLRLGGFVGDGAVIDTQFNTTDVAVVVMTELVTDKYTKHYERQRRD